MEKKRNSGQVTDARELEERIRKLEEPKVSSTARSLKMVGIALSLISYVVACLLGFIWAGGWLGEALGYPDNQWIRLLCLVCGLFFAAFGSLRLVRPLMADKE